MAGELCDGLHVHPFNSPKYLREVVHPAVEEGLGSPGAPAKDFTYATASFVVVGDTEKERAEQARMVKQQIAFYGSTRTYQPVLATHGWEDVAPKLHRKSRGGRLGRHGRPDHRRDARHLRGDRDLRQAPRRSSSRAIRGLLDRTALYQPYRPSLDDPRLPAMIRASIPCLDFRSTEGN